MLDAMTQYELAKVLHQDRLRELERARLARESQPPARGVHAVILSGLGRTLMALGEQMQAHAGTDERQPTHAASS